MEDKKPIIVFAGEGRVPEEHKGRYISDENYDQVAKLMKRGVSHDQAVGGFSKLKKLLEQGEYDKLPGINPNMTEQEKKDKIDDYKEIVGYAIETDGKTWRAAVNGYAKELGHGISQSQGMSQTQSQQIEGPGYTQQ